MNGLGELFDDLADEAKVYQVTDVAVSRANRHWSVRANGQIAVSVLVVAALLGVAVVLAPLFSGGRVAPPPGGPGRLDGVPAAVVRPLLDSPTRGSLAGDGAFVGDVLDMIEDDPAQYGLPADRSRLRVLYAGDLPGNRRLVLVAGATAAPVLITLTGAHRTSAARLRLTGWEDVEAPIVRSDQSGGRGNSGYVLVLGPAGYDVSVSSAPRYRADGTVTRDWQREPDGLVLRDTASLPPGLRVRFSRGDTILYESMVAAAGTERTATVDLTPLYGRGKPADRAATTAANALAYRFGLSGPDIRYIVLWSDDFPVVDPNDTGTGLGQIATVMAMTPDGGGPYITIATDASPQPNARDHPTGAGVTGDPANTLIAMRLPHFTPTQPGTLQVVAPPAATRAEVREGDTLLGEIPLTNGVGRLELPGRLDVTVHAYDERGTLLVERPFTDLTPGAGPVDPFEPEIRNW